MAEELEGGFTITVLTDRDELYFVKGNKESLDTSTPSGRFVLTIFGAVAQLEREYLLQRQKEGIAIAKQAGTYNGRKPLERAGQDTVIASWRSGEITAVEAMRTLKMSKTTFYRRVNQMEGRERP